MKITEKNLGRYISPSACVGRICCVDLRYYLIIDDSGVYRSVDLETGQVHSTPETERSINWLMTLANDPTVLWYDQVALS